MTDDAEAARRLGIMTTDDLANIPPRTRRGGQMVAIDRTPVRVRAESPHPVWWRGRQWAVTEYGIEALDGTYPIAAHRLTEKLALHSWLEHMGEKNWVDPDDFATAWLVALVLHGAGVEAAAVHEALRRQVVPARWDEGQ